MRILAVANPKGGAAKTTTAVTLAVIAAEAGKRVLVVDADENHGAADTIQRYGDRTTIDVTTEDDPTQLVQLRKIAGYDLIIVDLPGAKKGGELRALLRGAGTNAIADAVIMPTEGEALDLPVLRRAIRQEVEPAGVKYAIVLVRAEPTGIAAKAAEADSMRGDHQLSVFQTVVRRYAAHKDAQFAGVPITQYGGRRARHAEDDYRAVAAETWRLLGLHWHTDRKDT